MPFLAYAHLASHNNFQQKRHQTVGNSAFDALLIDSPSNVIIDEYLFALNADEGLIDLFGQHSNPLSSASLERPCSRIDRSKPISKAARALNL